MIDPEARYHVLHRMVGPMELLDGPRAFEYVGRHAGGTERYSLMEVALAAGSGTPSHYHREAEETLYFLRGIGAVTVGPRTFQVIPEQAVFIPAAIPHQIRNTGDKEMVYLAVCQPAWSSEDTVRIE